MDVEIRWIVTDDAGNELFSRKGYVNIRPKSNDCPTSNKSEDDGSLCSDTNNDNKTMRPRMYLSVWVRVISLGLVIGLVFFFGVITDVVVQFGREYISSDHIVSDRSVWTVQLHLILVLLTLLVITALTFDRCRNACVSMIETWMDYRALWRALYMDELTEKNLGPWFFAISSIIGICYVGVLGALGEPQPEGLLELIASFTFLVSGAFFLLALIATSNSQSYMSDNRTIRKILVGLLLFSLFVFGEEISWGQRIFDRKAFALFLEYNFQRETNLHNFFNPFFPYIYPLFGLGLFLSTLTRWLFPSSPQNTAVDLFTPHASLVVLFLIVASLSVRRNTEPFEQLFGVFLTFYSIRIFLCTVYPRRAVG